MNEPADKTICPSCGTPVKLGATRCYECGYSLLADHSAKYRKEVAEEKRIKTQLTKRQEKFARRHIDATKRQGGLFAGIGIVIILVGLIMLASGKTVPGVVLALAGALFGYMGYVKIKASATMAPDAKGAEELVEG